MISCIKLIPERRKEGWIGEGCLFIQFYKLKGKIRNRDKTYIQGLLNMNYCVSENNDEYIKFVFYPDL